MMIKPDRAVTVLMAAAFVLAGCAATDAQGPVAVAPLATTVSATAGQSPAALVERDRWIAASSADRAADDNLVSRTQPHGRCHGPTAWHTAGSSDTPGIETPVSAPANTIAADESELPTERDACDVNYGDLPAWGSFGEAENAALAAELDRWAEEQQRIATAAAAAVTPTPKPRQPAPAVSGGGAPAPASGSTCGLKAGDIPTDAQRACMFGGGGSGGTGGSGDDGGWDPETHDSSPLPAEPDWEPVEGYNPKPPAPSFDECPDGWIYDSKTGYRCL
jgi:hypothetical protein